MSAERTGGTGGRGGGELERARRARERHAGRLLSRPGVVSVGVGLDDEGRPAVVVGVTGVRASDAGLPGCIDGVPVLVRETGRPVAEDGE
ncbi:MAG: hypothetical protein IBX62_06320 [Coriobacteriia bacterium]|nr:hypothetical protein [Coriobacteriia bacterium]